MSCNHYCIGNAIICVIILMLNARFNPFLTTTSLGKTSKDHHPTLKDFLKSPSNMVDDYILSPISSNLIQRSIQVKTPSKQRLHRLQNK